MFLSARTHVSPTSTIKRQVKVFSPLFKSTKDNSATGAFAAQLSAAAVSTSAPEAARALVHCVVCLLGIPLAPEGGHLNPIQHSRPTATSSDDPLRANNNSQDSDTENVEPNFDQQTEDADGVEGVKGEDESQFRQCAPEVWCYELVLQCLQEAVICSAAVADSNLEVYLQQLLKFVHSDMVPMHVLTEQQAQKVKVWTRPCACISGPLFY